MCHNSCITFGRQVLGKENVAGKTVLEVGSMNVNGGLRELIESLGPAAYTGIDIAPGKGVDAVCACRDIPSCFGNDSFDLVLATEVLEHIECWQEAIRNMKAVCRPDGYILVSTRSKGFLYHGYPEDYWRFEVDDMRVIFSDYVIEHLEADAETPGIFLFARKPRNYVPTDLHNLRLYSIIAKRRVNKIAWLDKMLFLLWYRLRWGERS